MQNVGRCGELAKWELAKLTKLKLVYLQLAEVHLNCNQIIHHILYDYKFLEQMQ